MEGSRQSSHEFSMSWSLASTRGACSSRSHSSVMQQHLFGNTIRRPHFSTPRGDGSVDIMEKMKRLAPLPRFDPYRRMRAVSTSSVIETGKYIGCEWTSALGPMKRRRHNSECAPRGSFPVLQCNGVGVRCVPSQLQILHTNGVLEDVDMFKTYVITSHVLSRIGPRASCVCPTASISSISVTENLVWLLVT